MKYKQIDSLHGKIAIITGASSGIGETTALVFAKAGAVVVVAARREDRLERLAEQIRSQGGRCLPIPTDLTQLDQISNLVRKTIEAFDRIDILANIAGWGKYDWFEEFSPKELRQQFEVNVLGLAELTRQVVPIMKVQRSGHILNMCSYASRIAIPPLTVYASTKYAIEGLTDGLRRELLPWGIKVSRIHPSGVKGTEFNQKAARQGGIRYKSLPIGKLTREQVAHMLLDLVQNPKRERFASRLYDIPMFLNQRFPGLVDLISSLWVRLKRRAELEGDRRSATSILEPVKKKAPVMGGLLLAAVIGWSFSERMKRRGTS